MKFKIITMNKFYRDIKFPTRDIYGSYLSSDFSPIPGYNHKVFMIAFNLDARLYSAMEYLDIENYARSCIDSLNKTPKNKRDTSPVLGNLTFYSAKILTHYTGYKYIQVRALSDEKKNKMLFRIGDELEQVPSLKERKAKIALEESETDGDNEYVKKVEKVLSATPKKRGRPPKADKPVAKVENKTPKKRGRPPKNKKK